MSEPQVFDSASLKSDILSEMNRDRSVNDSFCDVILEVDGVKFKAHKIILAKVSVYFNGMFKAEMKEKYDSFANIKGMSATTMSSVLDFIYTAKVEISNENVLDLLAAAHYFQIFELLKLCSRYLTLSLSSENCIDLHVAATTYHLPVLKQKADEFIIDDFQKLLQSDKFKALSKVDAISILQVGNRNNKKMPIKDAYYGAIAWVKHDLAERKQSLSAILNCIDLYLLPADFIEEVILQENLVQTSAFITKSVKEALFWQMEEGSNNAKYNFVVLNEQKVKLFNIFTLQWRELPDLPQNFTGACFVAFDEYLYAFEEKYRILRIPLREENSTWKEAGRLLEPREKPKAIRHGDSILICGKRLVLPQNISRTPEPIIVECYNPTSKQSVEVASMTLYDGFSLTSVNGEVLAIGNNYYQTSIKAYNKKATWREVFGGQTPAPGAGAFATAVLVGDEVFCIESTGIIRCFSPKNRDWRSRQPHCCIYDVCDAVQIDGDVYLLGKRGNKYVLQNYESSLDKWKNIFSEENKVNCRSIAAI